MTLGDAVLLLLVIGAFAYLVFALWRPEDLA